MSRTETWILEERDTDVARIRVVEGPDAGLEHVLEAESASIGSGPAAHMRLRDQTVSRLHCEIRRADGEVRLRDLGSKNGCFVSGVRVIEIVLAPGARVSLGQTAIEAAVGRQRRKRPRYYGGDHFGALLGPSSAMQDLFAMAARVAELDGAVLIRGEPGTGKELLARAIHDASARKDGPLVVLDCAALSASLADVELFGHARGAFTGADVDRPGIFERANGGTLLLDEIGELPFDLQPKLLRALDRGEVRRIGENAERRVDARVIAITSARLESRVNEGSFREDLLHRLGALELCVPPLRARGRDVPAIAESFVAALKPNDAAVLELVRREVTARAGYQWPGNVRELRAMVRRIVALGSADLGAPPIGGELPIVRLDLPFHDAKRVWTDIFEHQYLAHVLDETGGNVADAARRAGLNRAHLHELLDKLGLRARR